MQLIVNADDFGMSVEGNVHTMELLDSGHIQSVSIMPNQPAFEHGIHMLRDAKLESCCGLHITLDDGPALSERMRNRTSDGRLAVGKSIFVLNRDLIAAVEAEIEAQVEKMIRAGIRPTHIDSHHHLHTRYSILVATMRVARRYGIPRIRLAGNINFPRSFANQLYRNMINTMIRSSGLARTRCFTYLDRYMRKPPHLSAGTTVELMVHPADKEDRQLLLSGEFAALRAK
jgi:predicted glycoside hydrolase/deacetylase ChbG (UPF0249 family)